MELLKFAQLYFSNYKPSKFEKEILSQVEKGKPLTLIHKPSRFSKWKNFATNNLYN